MIFAINEFEFLFSVLNLLDKIIEGSVFVISETNNPDDFEYTW